MRLELAALKPNPFRDFKVDPIDEAAAERLKESICQDGFWGGVVCRKGKNGDIEIAAGHTRVYAAMKAGLTYADLHVGKYDEAAMIRIYMTENLTQRGANSGLAMAGGIASAVRHLIKKILTNDEDVRQICLTSHKAFEIIRGQISSDKGLGYDIVLNFFKGVSGINVAIVKHHLANLKASGAYARIVREVSEEIAQEHAAELVEIERKQREAEEAQKEEEVRKARAKKEAAKRKQWEIEATAKKATEAASRKKPTFDLEGVGKHLTNAYQLRTFREIAESDSGQRYLPFEHQAKLAEALIARAEKLEQEPSGAFIKANMEALIMDAAWEQGRLDKEAKKQLELENVRERWNNRCHDLMVHIGALSRLGQELIELKDKHPDLPFSITTDLRKTVSYARTVINELAEKLKP